MKQKHITKVYHFTRVENLENIFRYGLLPRTNLDEKGIAYVSNDDQRLDNCWNAISVSIEFPNYKMFYGLRCEHKSADWAVLLLDAQLLWKFPCAFCWTNAADSSVSSIPPENRMTAEVFYELFENKDGYPLRDNLNIPDCYPTNPQAEVLVFHSIPINFIKAVYFENHEAQLKYFSNSQLQMCFCVYDKVFYPRSDYNKWS